MSEIYSKVFGQDVESMPAYTESWPHEEDPEIQLPAAGVVMECKIKRAPREGDLDAWNWQTHRQGWGASDK